MSDNSIESAEQRAINAAKEVALQETQTQTIKTIEPKPAEPTSELGLIDWLAASLRGLFGKR